MSLLTHDRGVESLFLSHGPRKGTSAGFWSLGAVLRCERTKARGRVRLRALEIELMMRRASTDLSVFHHLSYALEIGRALGRDGPLSIAAFELFTSYVAFLELNGAEDYRLLTWQLALFDALGMALEPWPCRISGEAPDAFSMDHGGAVKRALCSTALPVSTDALHSLAKAWQMDYQSAMDIHAKALHSLMQKLWEGMFGHPLKSAIYLDAGLSGVK